jgi:RNA recognition motif-containing protein
VLLYCSSPVCLRYGFITFETEEEAKRVLREGDNLVLKGRKLNVAIAIKKQQVGRIGEFSFTLSDYEHKDCSSGESIEKAF